MIQNLIMQVYKVYDETIKEVFMGQIILKICSEGCIVFWNRDNNYSGKSIKGLCTSLHTGIARNINPDKQKSQGDL